MSNNGGATETQDQQNQEDQENNQPQEAPKFFRMRASSGGLQPYNAAAGVIDYNLMALEAENRND